MTDISTDASHSIGAGKTPLHLWVVGGVSLLWNAFGALDYTMTQTRNAAYLAQFTAEQIAYIDTIPAWGVAAWAFGVWGAIAGSILMLVRSHHAAMAFGVSLAGLLVSTIWQFLLADRPMPGATSTGSILLNLAIWAAAIALIIYARRMRSAGVLR
jgi:hypothetical protein